MAGGGPFALNSIQCRVLVQASLHHSCLFLSRMDCLNNVLALLVVCHTYEVQAVTTIDTELYFQITHLYFLTHPLN